MAPDAVVFRTCVNIDYTQLVNPRFAISSARDNLRFLVVPIFCRVVPTPSNFNVAKSVSVVELSFVKLSTKKIFIFYFTLLTTKQTEKKKYHHHYRVFFLYLSTKPTKVQLYN